MSWIVLHGQSQDGDFVGRMIDSADWKLYSTAYHDAQSYLDEIDTTLLDRLPVSSQIKYYAVASRIAVHNNSLKAAEMHAERGLNMLPEVTIDSVMRLQRIRLLATRGHIESIQADPTASVRTFNEALSLVEISETSKHDLSLYIYNIQAINYMALGRFEQALGLFNILLDHYETENELGPSVLCMGNIAHAYFAEGKYNEGWHILERSIRKQEQYPALFKEELLLAYATACRVLLDMGRIDETTPYLNKGAAALADAVDPRHVAYFYEAEAQVYEEQDLIKEAIRSLEKGLMHLNEAAKPNTGLQVFTEDVISLLTFKMDIATIHYAGQTQPLLHILEEVDTLLEDFNELWLSAPNMEARNYLYEQFELGYDTYIHLIHELSKSGYSFDRFSYLTRIFNIDRYRSALWTEQYRFQQELDALALDVKNGMRWYKGIDSLSMLMELAGSSVSEEEHQAINNQVFTWSDSLNWWRSSHGLSPLSLLSRTMEEEVAKLESWLSGNNSVYMFSQTQDRVDHILITQDTIILHIMDDVVATEDAVIQWLDQLALGASDSVDPKKLHHAGNLVYELFEPIIGLWPEEVVVMQYSDFATVPFAALNRAIPDLPYDHVSADYLLQDHDITYSWTLQSWLNSEDVQESIDLNNTSYWLPNQSSITSIAERRPQQLAFANVERQQIQKLVGGEDANVDYHQSEVLINDCGDILHFIGHTKRAEGGIPTVSLPVQIDDDVNMYTSSDVLFTDEQPGLIFANACETDFGYRKQGKGSYAFMRGFAMAGIPNIINTIWPVEDSRGAAMAISFYVACEAGETTTTALRRAQLIQLEDNDPYYSHPFYWASYLHYGVGAELRHGPLLSNKMSYFAICVLVLLIGIYWTWNYKK